MTAIYRRFTRERARAWPRRPMPPSASSCRSRWRAGSTSSAITLDRILRAKYTLFRDFTLSLARALAKSRPPSPSIAPTWARTAASRARDRARIEHADRRAPAAEPHRQRLRLRLVRDALLLRYPPAADAAGERAEQRLFAMRFQQITGPVTAKAVEDTAHYRYDRLVSLNEVGSDPLASACPPAVFHDDARRLARWPDAPCARRHMTPRAGRGRPRSDRRVCRAPELWRRKCGAGARSPAASRATSTDQPPRSKRRVPALPDLVGAWPPRDADEPLEVFHRPHPRLHGKGTKEDQGPHQLG